MLIMQFIFIQFMKKHLKNLFKFHNFKMMTYQCSYCNTLHFKNEIIQSDRIYNSCCNNDKIILLITCTMSLILKDLFSENILKIKHFQQQINVYNNIMIFISCMFNHDKCLNINEKDI